MVDLTFLSPEQKHLVIHGDANCQFVYVNHQPIYANRITQKIADKIGEVYNNSVIHERILEIHSPLMDLINETNLDNVSMERIVPIMENLIKYDYTMFLDLMTILASMLEAKDIEKKSDYIDYIFECSNEIISLSNVIKANNNEDNTLVEESTEFILDENHQGITEDVYSTENNSSEE